MFARLIALAALAAPALAAPIAGPVVPRSGEPWTLCAAQPIYSATVGPCARSASNPDVCVLERGSNYTLSITWTPEYEVESPRAGAAGFDDGREFAYPGQTFDACAYTTCPLRPQSIFTYTYPFHVFRALDFDKLLVNVTDGVFGPSVLCVEVPVELAPVEDASSSSAAASASEAATSDTASESAPASDPTA
ncbi:hypothetical protein Q5752_004267 [Cryptotrichosporon argae]